MSSIQSSPMTPPQPMNEPGAAEKPGEIEEEKKKKKQPLERKLGDDGGLYELTEIGGWIRTTEPPPGANDEKVTY